MAKHLSDRDINQIVEILDGWRGKLTWNLFCEACKTVVGREPSRQTLFRQPRIKKAFEGAKKRIALPQDTPLPCSLRAAGERIARLENENKRLVSENNLLLQQFVVWQYNAFTRGISERDLNRPLPEIDRGKT